MKKKDKLATYLDKTGVKVRNYLNQPEVTNRFAPQELREQIFAYLNRGGKMLRPSLLLLAAEAVGGKEVDKFIPAAAAVEIFHIFTLVHDDIIDRDGLRRGGDTVHFALSKAARKQDLTTEEAQHYGLSLGILTGDLQLGLATSLLLSLPVEKEIITFLISSLIEKVLNPLVEGEALDFQFSRLFFLGNKEHKYQATEKLKLEKIEDMMYKKTAVLLAYAVTSGALLGLNNIDISNPYVKSLSDFALNLGLAFQFYDDYLGINGEEKKLGKPVGTDISEGKFTPIIFYALSHSKPKEKSFILDHLGEKDLPLEKWFKIKTILADCGALNFCLQKAQNYYEQAINNLQTLPANEARLLLEQLAKQMINRNK